MEEHECPLSEVTVRGILIDLLDIYMEPGVDTSFITSVYVIIYS
jgi:hypothetical protein